MLYNMIVYSYIANDRIESIESYHDIFWNDCVTPALLQYCNGTPTRRNARGMVQRTMTNNTL